MSTCTLVQVAVYTVLLGLCLYSDHSQSTDALNVHTPSWHIMSLIV